MDVDTALQMGLGLFPQLQSSPGVSVPWWIWALVILAGMLVVGFSIFIRMGSDNPQPPAASATPPPASPAAAVRSEEPPQAKATSRTAEIDAGHMKIEAESGPAGSVAREIALPQPELEGDMEAAESDPEISPAIFVLGPDREDLKLVQGVTPGIATVLNAAGIRTFAQLAGTGTEQLEKILRSAGIRTNNSSSWPQQAALAAKGDWEGLNALQQKLRLAR